MLVDTHAHLNDLEAFPDCRAVIAALQENGIGKVVVVGADFFDSMIGVGLTEIEGVYASVGTHPNYVVGFTDGHANAYSALLALPKVVALGEIGLDYHYDGFDKRLQWNVFERQIEIAHRAEVPIIVHIRDAYEDALAVLKNNAKLLGGGALLHCFSGSVEYMNQVLALGFDIAIGGAVTFKNARKLLDVAREVPLDRLHLETDCPYLCPDRGKRNEPRFVGEVARKIAEVKGVSFEQVERVTELNAERLFTKMK